jgi:electron transfer flavoprotein alpha/beta subunit
MNVMKAMKAQIKKVDLASLGLNAAEVGTQAAKMKVQKYFPQPKRPSVRMIKEDFPDKNYKILFGNFAGVWGPGVMAELDCRRSNIF